MTPKKQFAVFALSISITLALLFVYAYGAVFQHDRYWSGTLAKVQKTEASIIANLLRGRDLGKALPDNVSELEQLFAPLDRKLIIEIDIIGELFFSNQEESWKKDGLLEEVKTQDATIKISSYVPPTWNSRFLRWLRNPTRWFEPSYDFITVPFILLFIIFLSFLYALGWRLRSLHLSENVLKKLEDPEGPQK